MRNLLRATRLGHEGAGVRTQARGLPRPREHRRPGAKRMLVQVLGRLLSALNRLSGCRLCRASSRGPGPQTLGKEGEMGSPGLPQEPRLSAAGAPEPDLRTGGEGGLPAALDTWRRLPPREAALLQGRSSSVERVARGAHQGRVLGQRALPGRDRRDRACRDQGGRQSRYEGELRTRHGAANPRSSSPRAQSAQTSFPAPSHAHPPSQGHRGRATDVQEDRRLAVTSALSNTRACAFFFS